MSFENILINNFPGPDKGEPGGSGTVKPPADRKPDQRDRPGQNGDPKPQKKDIVIKPK